MQDAHEADAFWHDPHEAVARSGFECGPLGPMPVKARVHTQGTICIIQVVCLLGHSMTNPCMGFYTAR